MEQLQNYLQNTIKKLKSKNFADVNLVIGNESCDLDSAVSAVVYAVFLNWQHNQIKSKVCTRLNRDECNHKDDIFAPILNVSRNDYPLKTEVAYSLREAGVFDDILIFRDDLDLKDLVETSKAKVTLVDHHSLSKNDQFLSPHVAEIIDHRPLDKTHWQYKDDTRSTIEIVGSCCTLITRRIIDQSALVASPEDFFKEFRICADLLHSTIILDTVNFSKEVDKATPLDVEMATFLETLLQFECVEVERQSKLDRLVAARSDVSALDANQLLRKDVKVFADVLVPSFPVLVKDFLNRPGAIEAVCEALRARGCSVALLLGMDLSGALRRDAAVWSTDKNRADKLCQLMESWQPSLELSAEELCHVKYYSQRNLRASRKQYIPIVNKFLDDTR